MASLKHLKKSLSRDTVLIAAGLLLAIGTLVVSAVAAPPVTGSPTVQAHSQTLVGSQGGGPGWHQHGSVYLLNGSTVSWREASADSYFDVTETPNGTVLAAFMDGGYESCGPYTAPCPKTGFRVIDPEPTPHVILEYSFPVRTKTNSEVHDVERLQSGEYLLTDMEHERVFTVKNGTVTWQWNASNLYNAPPDPTTTDWLHINDVDVIGEDRFLVSVRNANQLVLIERGQGVVEIINEDVTDSNDENCRQPNQLAAYGEGDDIRCGDPSTFNHQHNPQWLGPGAVLVADSDNNRVVELHQKGNGTWEPAWSLGSAGGLRFAGPRDADRLPNGNTLITDSRTKRIVVVNESGDVVWGVKTERVPYEADRLPYGEVTHAQRYSLSTVHRVAISSDLPVLSRLLTGLRGLYPALPYWFREPQLGLVVASLILIGAGTFDHLRQ